MFRARVSFLARLRLSGFLLRESFAKLVKDFSSFNEWCTHLPCRRSIITLPRRILFGTLFRARVSFLARLRLFFFESQTRSWSKTSSFNEDSWCTRLPMRRPPCHLACRPSRRRRLHSSSRAGVPTLPRAKLSRAKLSNFQIRGTHARATPGQRIIEPQSFV
jgi:hypothetical protein